MSNYHQITINSPSPTRNLVLPASAAAAKGLAYQESDTRGTAELADGTKPLAGFVMREVRDGGPTILEVEQVAGMYAYNITDGNPGLIPFAAGGAGAFELAEEVDVEGSGLIVVEGGQALAANTTLGTELSFTSGKFQKAADGQLVEFLLAAKPTPRVTDQVRIVARRVAGYVKAAAA